MEEKKERLNCTISFEDGVEKLKEIISKLESDNLTLENSIDLFKKGIELCYYCNKKLEEAQGVIQILTKDKQEELREMPYELPDGENDIDDI